MKKLLSVIAITFVVFAFSGCNETKTKTVIQSGNSEPVLATLFSQNGNYIVDVALTSDGKTLFAIVGGNSASDSDGAVFVYDVTDNGITQAQKHAVDGLFNAISLSSDDSKMLLAGSGVLALIDISDTSEPITLGTYEDEATFLDVMFVDNDTKAYVVDKYDGVALFDLSDPDSLTEIDSIDLGNNHRKIALSSDGTELYVAQSNMFHILDVNVSHPTNVFTDNGNNHSWMDNVIAVTVSGDNAYVGLYNEGIAILDISNPASISVLDSEGFDSLAPAGVKGRHITLNSDETVAYVSSAEGEGPYYTGIVSVDISDKSDISLLDSYYTGDPRASVLSSDGKTLFVADENTGVRVIDVTTSTDLAEAQTVYEDIYNLALSSDEKKIYFVAQSVEDDDGEQLVVADISNLKSPKVLGSLDFEGADSRDIQVVGTTVYVTFHDDDGDSEFQGVKAVDFSDPTDPEVTEVATDNAKWMDLTSDQLYIADSDGGLVEMNISSTPTINTTYDGFFARDVKISSDGTKAYIAADGYENGDNTFVIVNIDADSEGYKDLIYEGSYDEYSFAGKFVEISPDGETMVILDPRDEDLIAFFDISTPTAPKLLSTMDLDNVYDAKFSANGEILYVASRNDYVAMLDISNLNIPAVSSLLLLEDDARAMVLSNNGKRAYVAADDYGVKVINISSDFVGNVSYEDPNDLPILNDK